MYPNANFDITKRSLVEANVCLGRDTLRTVR